MLKALKAEALPKRWLLGVSGGVDSLVLAEIIWRWRKLLKVELAIGHVHHGVIPGKQGEYRDQAQAAVREWARAHKVRFITLKARPRAERSEAELRDLRHRTLAQWRRRFRYDLVVLAHHRDDLLETRLLRLIRGSGLQGLTAMQVKRGSILRPLLALSRAEIESYADARGLSALEDPSNTETEAMRNWLRREWLPVLENRQRGAIKSLSRSLETLAPELADETQLGNYVGLRRKEVRAVSFPRQQTLVASFLRALGAREYSRTHVEEILKRLSTSRGEFTFEMLGFIFRVTPDLLWASRV